MSAEVFIAAGSNLGERLGNLRAADGLLRRCPALSGIAWSPVYETSPVGGPRGQPDYLNAVARAQASTGPHEVLELLLDIEHQLGRRRDRHWGPRILDLDLLLYGSVVMAEPGLILPHPRLHLRRFVLQPLADLAPDLTHPVLGLTMGELLGRLDADPTSVRPISSSI